MHPKGRLIIWDSMPLAAYGVTHQGRRSTNEDSWLVDLDLGLLVVADGMGGHNAGEVASALAVQVIRDVFAGSGDIPREALLTRAVQSANERILTAAAEQPAHSGWGRRLWRSWSSMTVRFTPVLVTVACTCGAADA